MNLLSIRFCVTRTYITALLHPFNIIHTHSCQCSELRDRFYVKSTWKSKAGNETLILISRDTWNWDANFTFFSRSDQRCLFEIGDILEMNKARNKKLNQEIWHDGYFLKEGMLRKAMTEKVAFECWPYKSQIFINSLFNVIPKASGQFLFSLQILNLSLQLDYQIWPKNQECQLLLPNPLRNPIDTFNLLTWHQRNDF